MKVGAVALFFLTLPVALGCSGSGPELAAPGSVGNDPVMPVAAPPPAPTASAEAEAPPPPPPAEPALPTGMSEFDLSRAGATWKGWVVVAPKEARVLSDGVEDARIGIDGFGTLDLVFSQKPRPLAERKAALKPSASPAKGLTVKQTILADVPEKLEWSSTRSGKGGTGTTFYFFRNYQASGVPVSCGMLFDGAKSREELAEFEKVCDSLKKK